MRFDTVGLFLISLTLCFSLVSGGASVVAMVSLHGRTTGTLRRSAHTRLLSPSGNGLHEASERPPSPHTLLTTEQLQRKVGMLVDWFQGKKNVLALTGAGLSTESGIPDYRGHAGSYHNGHKPMIHDQFMSSAAQRQRYWGRAMVGWRDFDEMQPNTGHHSLTRLEKRNKIGVAFEDSMEYYRQEDLMDWTTRSGQHRMSVITQNVDSLHRKAETRHVTELHGRTDRLKCMSCGTFRPRQNFHDDLERLNADWLLQVLEMSKQHEDESSALRPDGDAYIAKDNYSDVVVPNCQKCGGFFKPDVVFFGDNVPKHRVKRCQAAVRAADGLLCVGSSLAVHSAYRFVKAATSLDIPVAVLNVGKTRAEEEGLDVLKLEAPVGPTLSACADYFVQQDAEGP